MGEANLRREGDWGTMVEGDPNERGRGVEDGGSTDGPMARGGGASGHAEGGRSKRGRRAMRVGRRGETERGMTGAH